MNANKKQRTEERGPAAAVAATPLVESVAPVFGCNPTNETWGDGMKWDEMDHNTRLRFLTPRFSETGRPDKPEIAFFDYLPQAVKDPLSAERVAQMKTARNTAIKDVKAFFVRAKERKERQEQREKNKKNDDDSSDDYASSDEGNAFTTSTFQWNDQLTEEEALEFVTMLPEHLTFTAGFDADAGNEQQAKRCCCPCSKTSQQWHKVAGQKVESVVGKMEFECKRGCYGPTGLLDHLRGKPDPLHHGVLAYVNKLHPNFKKA